MASHLQRSAFLEGEGDAWYLRNAHILDRGEGHARRDPIIAAVERLPVKPRHIFEVGASNGWRLAVLHEATGARCEGIEPSAAAVAAAAARYPGISMHLGTADSLPCADASIDLLVFGFCLYLCDREDLFRIAAECDRVLVDGGRLIILDFSSSIAYRNPYAPLPGLYAYKMNYERMFTWNPAYRLTEQLLTDHGGGLGSDPNDRLSLTVLVKDLAGAYIDNPYKRCCEEGGDPQTGPPLRAE